MTLSRRAMLKLLSLGAVATASGLLLPVPVLAATARRSGTNENISTFKATGGDYTTFSTWDADTDNNLVSSTTTEVLELYADGSPYAMGGSVTFAGATTNATYFRIVRVAPGQGFTGVPGAGVQLTATVDANLFSVSEDHFHLYDLDIIHTINSATTRGTVAFNNPNGVGVGLLLKGVNNGAGTCDGIRVLGTGTVLVNCLVYACDQHGIRFNSASGASAVAYNCTAAGNGSDGFSVLNINDCVVVLKNCLSTDNGVDFDTFDTGTTHCASQDATANGASARTSQTFTFVNAAGQDYHLAPGDTGALGFGTSLAADATFAFTDDVDAQPISTWSIGFDAHLAAAAAIRQRRIFRWE